MKLQATSYKLKTTLAFTMLEVLIGASILTTSFLGVLTVFDRLIKSSHLMVELAQATTLMEEGLEVGRIFRDQSWTNLDNSNWPSGTSYYLNWTGSAWATTTTITKVDGKFYRQLNLTSVNRHDTSKDIVVGSGTDDPNTKLLTVTVAWRNSNATTTKTMSAYLTKLF